MMKNIYKNNIEILNTTNDIISACRIQNYNRAARLFSSWISKVSGLVSGISENKDVFGEENCNTLHSQLTLTIGDVLKAQERNDYILIADALEINMLPIMYSIQSVLGEYLQEADKMDYYEANLEALRKYDKDLANLLSDEKQADNMVASDKSYIIENTQSGLSTLRIERTNEAFYLEGNVDPVRDSKVLFDSYYDINADSYIVLGTGLGYLLSAINSKIKDAVQVTAYETDLEVIKLALKNTDLTDFLSNGHRIIYDNNLNSFAKHIENKTDKDILVMHHPSIRNIDIEGIRDKMETLFIHDASFRGQMFDMLTNLKSNIKHCNRYVDELKEIVNGKDVYLIAAGPSLDSNIHLLKKKPDNSIIIAVGRVFRKLYNEGIDVDFVTFLDASDRIYGQYYGLENTNVPLLIASTACRRIAKISNSEKYLICQKGMSEAEEYANKRGYNTYSTGGSVATITFDIAASLGAKRIIAVGLDLSYSNNKTHTDGAYSKNLSDTSGLIKIKGINEKEVYTTKIMEIYRIWFENRISELISEGSKSEFINATECGANINGMKNIKLSDVIF